jgi:hypothetical protein
MASKAPKANRPSSKFSLKLWLGIPFGLFLILLVILSQIDLESVKEELVQRISQETGLKVEMGSIGFGFSRGIGLQCKGVKVSTPEGHHFSVDRLHLLAEWRPLLQGEVKIKSATLHQPEITLEIPSASAEQPPAVEKKPSEKPPEKQELIDPATLQASRDKLKTTPLSIEKFIISDGKITLIRSGTPLSFNIDATLVMDQGERLDISAESVKVQTSAIIIEGEAMASNLTTENAGIALNLKSDGFSWKELQPALQFFGTPETPLKSVDVNQLLLKTELPLNSLSNIETLKQQITGRLEIKTQNIVLKMADQNHSFEFLNGEGTWDKGVLQHNFTSKALGSDLSINGKFPFADLNKDSVTRVDWKNLDLEKLPLKKGQAWSPSQGMVSGNVSLTGPIPKESETFPGKLKGALKFDVQNLKLLNNDSQSISFNQLEGSGELVNNKLNYRIKGDPFNGTLQSDGRISLSTSKASAPVLNNRIEFSNLDLNQLPLSEKPDKGSLSGTIQLNGPLPDPENFLTGKLKIDTTFKLNDIKMSNPPLDIQSLEGKSTLNQGQLMHDINGILYGGKVKAKGTLAFHKNKTLITANSNLTLDKINLSKIPEVHKSGLTSGTITGNLNINGPLPAEGKISPALKLKGTLEGNKLVLEEKQIEKVKLDIKESSTDLGQVKVEIEQIKLEKQELIKVAGLFKITPEKIDLTGGRISPLNGLIKLVGDFKPESGSYRLKFKGDKLKAEDFLSPHLKGPLQMAGTLGGTLPKNTAGMPGYARDLSGNIKLKLVDGALPELGVAEKLLTLLNPTSLLEAQKTGLGYDYMGGDFKIIKGVVNTSNFEMKGPQLNITVEGQANLVEDTVLAQVKAMPLQMLDKTLKAIPLLGQILTGGKKGGLIETYFKVDGKLSQPDITLQPHKSLLNKPGSILEQIIKIPENLTGGE